MEPVHRRHLSADHRKLRAGIDKDAMGHLGGFAWVNISGKTLGAFELLTAIARLRTMLARAARRAGSRI